MPPQPIEVLDTVLGTSYLAIQATIKLHENKKLDLSEYEFDVAKEKEGDWLLVGMFKGERKQPMPFTLGATMPQENGFDAARELDHAFLRAMATRWEKMEKVDTLHGQHLPAIQSALPTFHDRKLNLLHYQIQVVRDGDVLVIVFVDKERRPNSRGGGGKRPGIQVKLDAENLKVLSSNFLR